MSFAGVSPVLQIPFGRGTDEPVLHESLGRLVDRLIAAGVDGLVALGLASEADKLTEVERDAVCATVAEAVGGRVPYVVGISGPKFVAVDRARRAVEHGASALMVLPPPRPADTPAVRDHFLGVAQSAEVPILIQDSPQVTGIELDADTLLGLADRDPLLRAVKIEGPRAGSKTSAAAEAGLEVVAGWGGLHYLESLRRGAVGCMPGSDLGPAIREIHRLAAVSPPAANELYLRILPLLSYAAQSLDLLILAAKRALMRFGVFPTSTVRQPGRELDEEEAVTLDALFDALEADRVPGW